MDIEKLREEIEYDEGSVNKIYLDNLGLPTLASAILLLNGMKNMDGKLEQLSAKIDALNVSTPISKLSCQTATDYIQTLMSYQRKCKE